MPSYSSIIDNRDDNTLLRGLVHITPGGQELCIASAFFSLDALLMLADSVGNYNRIRLLFGDDADVTQRRKLLERLKVDSDADLLVQREQGLALLSPLKKVEAIFAEHRFEARCYVAKKFHAKAYLMKRGEGHPPVQGILGSGNFTRSGLTRNIELNAHLTIDQAAQLETWFDERWNEAIEDVVTQEILTLIKRQTELYHPYVIYQKALKMWGDYISGPGSIPSDLPLDPHQEQGYLQALRIIERENGVMVCDGVGLGKSFIGLALMEHFCREGNNVLLVAPKNILESAWNEYLKLYMKRFRQPFGNIHEMAATDFGFDADEGEESDESPASLAEKRRLRDDLMDRTDVVVIDEAHNFRTTASSRYKNLYRVLDLVRGRRKKVILLTATPINTEYADLSAQLALISHEKGSLAGYSIGQVRSATRSLDRAMLQIRKAGNALAPGQLTLELGETANDTLNRVLENVLIQRSRKTCKAMAEAVGKPLVFPERKPPICIEYAIGPESQGYRDLIDEAHRRFDPGVALIKQMREEVKKAEAKSQPPAPARDIKRKLPGIKLAAFLTEQYRLEAVAGIQRYQAEVRLAGLVFANTLKQLESSPPAFQGILQSLGEGLIARLQFVFGDDARTQIEPHLGWVRTPLFERNQSGPIEGTQDVEMLIADGDALDLDGAETDDWLAQSVKERGLGRKLREFTADKFDIERWRTDIEADLFFLQEIHEKALRARTQPDPKLKEVYPVIASEVALGRRVLVFTQSQRTGDYLEREIKKLLPTAGIARIDSRVETTRRAILHAFSPGYNPVAHSASVPNRVDVLISTDVLSEGVNLQEAGAILNYDIHWNPVRLIQRIGRVDRRLNPAITPAGHSFDIYNVLPPPEINDILGLVGVVEDRTLRISRTLGLDSSFFKSTDPADNLREFNARCDGEMTSGDIALTEYLRSITTPDPDVVKDLERVPPGAFGVWSHAPHDGLFALFTLEATNKATAQDREKFASELGHPILILERPSLPPLTNTGDVFEILRKTVKAERSGTPSDEADLNSRLQKLKNHVRQQFAEIELPRTIVPRLVCWMELKKQGGH